VPLIQPIPESVDRNEEFLLRSLLEESVAPKSNPPAGIGLLRQRGGVDIGRLSSPS
jgi:hypothetical protein